MRLIKEDLSFDLATLARGIRISRGDDGRLTVDASGLAEELERLFRTLEDSLDKHVDAVNANAGSSIVADALPTAALKYLGVFVTLRKVAPAADELHWCYKNGAGAYAWFKIV